MKTFYKLTSFFLAFVLTTSIVFAQHWSRKDQKKVNTISINNFGGALKIQEGFWTATKENDIVHVQLTNSRNNKGSFFISIAVNESDFKKNGSTSFELVRESGKMLFNGSFPQNESTGKFTFSENENFQQFLKGKVLTSVTKNDDYYFFKLFLGDVTKAYVNGIRQKGYKPTLKQLGKLAIHEVSLDYIDALAKTNYKNLDLDMLVRFAIHDISIAYINELKNAGYGDIDAQMVKRFAIHGVRANYIDDLSKVGYGNLEANMLKKFATHKINSNYIKSLLATNIYKPSANDIKKAKIHRISANFIKDAKNKGYDSQDLSYYIKLKVRGAKKHKVKI